MDRDIEIKAMNENFILYRCIHAGPLSPQNIKEKSKNVSPDLQNQFKRNEEFFKRLIEKYGSCAILAIKNDSVIGHVRFYPEFIYQQANITHLCCQEITCAPTPDMVNMELLGLDDLVDPILRIQCWHVHKDYRGKGLSHRLLAGLLDWVKNNWWKAIRAKAAVDNYWVASQACALPLRTYIKYGFQETGIVPSADLKNWLLKFKNGEFGNKGRKAFENACAKADLSQIAVYYDVKYPLDY